MKKDVIGLIGLGVTIAGIIFAAGRITEKIDNLSMEVKDLKDQLNGMRRVSYMSAKTDSLMKISVDSLVGASNISTPAIVPAKK